MAFYNSIFSTRPPKLITGREGKKVNTRGLKQANKCMLMAATAFNVKKLLKYAKKPRIPLPNSMELGQNPTINSLKELFLSFSPLTSFSRYQGLEKGI
jgi:hypothetical protein